MFLHSIANVNSSTKSCNALGHVVKTPDSSHFSLALYAARDQKPHGGVEGVGIRIK